MSEIVVSSGSFDWYTGSLTHLKLRIYNKKTFATTENELVLGNTLGSANFYKEIPVTCGTDCNNDQTDCISVPTFVIDSTTDGTPNDSGYTFVLYDNNGNPIKTIACDQRVWPTANPTTLADIFRENASSTPDLPNTYYTAAQVDALLAALTGAATKATDVIYGVVTLSQPAAVSSAPIVLGVNDKRWVAVTESYFLENYGGDLGAAITAIAASQAELVFTCPYVETIDRSIPVNIMVRIEGDGKITVDDTKTLTINSLGALGDRQYFFGTGTGKVLLGRGATNEINATWWAPYNETTDQTIAIQNIFASADNQGVTGGATVSFGAGKWKLSEVTLPNATRIKCAGHDPDGGQFGSFTYFGTVFELYDLTKGYVFKLPTSFRNITIEDCTITSATAPAASPLKNNITATCDGFTARRVGFQSTYSRASIGEGASTSPLVLWHAPAGQQCTNSIFELCWFQVPVNGTGLYCDTPNSSITVNTCSPQCLAGATWLHEHNAGQILVENPLGQGVDDFTDIAVTSNRDITAASVVRIVDQITPGQPFARLTLKADTPSDKLLTSNDIFRRFDFDGVGFTGAYITKILSPYTANLSFYPVAPIVEQPCTVKTFGDCPHAAHAMFLCDGNIVNMTVVNGIEEGFNYSFIGGCAEFATFKFVNYFGQGRVQFNETLAFNSDTCHWPANAFEDNLGSQALDVTFTGKNVFSNNWVGNLLFAETPGVWRIQRITDNVSASLTPQFNAIVPQYAMATDLYNFVNPQVTAVQQEMYADYAVANTDPVLGLYTKAVHGTVTDQKHLFRIGHKDLLTDTWTYYYDDLRNEVTGRKETIANQTGQGGLVGWNFNGDIFVANHRGGCIYPTQIAANANDYAGGVGPTSAGLYDVRNIRVSFATDYLKLAGVVLDYLDTDGIGYPDGTTLTIENVGTKIGVLPNEDTGSTNIARLKTCTGQQLYLMPDCSAQLIYRKGSTPSTSTCRWSTSLMGTPNSPVFEGAARFNTLTTITAGATPAIDATVSNNGKLTPLQDETISITPGLTGAIYWLKILTSGTTSRKLTFGTNFVNVRPFNTGIVDAQTYDIFFKESEGAMVEVSRTEPINTVTLGTSGAQTCDFSKSERFVLVPTADCTLTAASIPVGRKGLVNVVTSGSSSFNITFSTGFIAAGVLATGTVSGKMFNISFEENYATMNEKSRTIAMS